MAIVVERDEVFKIQDQEHLVKNHNVPMTKLNEVMEWHLNNT